MGRSWRINARLPDSPRDSSELCFTQPPRGAHRETHSLKTLVDSSKGFIAEGASCEPSHLLELLTPSYTVLRSSSALANHLTHVPLASQMSPGVFSSPPPLSYSPTGPDVPCPFPQRGETLGYVASCQPTPNIRAGWAPQDHLFHLLLEEGETEAQGGAGSRHAAQAVAKPERSRRPHPKSPSLKPSAVTACLDNLTHSQPHHPCSPL